MTEPERRITAIEQQKRNLERVNVFLDGEFAFGVFGSSLRRQIVHLAVIFPIALLSGEHGMPFAFGIQPCLKRFSDLPVACASDRLNGLSES